MSDTNQHNVNSLEDIEDRPLSNYHDQNSNENEAKMQEKPQYSKKKKNISIKKQKNKQHYGYDSSQTVQIDENQQFKEQNNKESSQEKFSVAKSQHKQKKKQRETKNLPKLYGSVIYKAIKKKKILQQGIKLCKICYKQILKSQVQVSASFKGIYRGKRSLRIFINLYFVFQNPQRYYQLIETEKQLCCSKIFEETLSWMFRSKEFILMEMSIIKKIRKINKINMIQLTFVRIN